MMTTSINRPVEFTVDIQKILISTVNAQKKVKDVGLDLGMTIIFCLLFVCAVIFSPFIVIGNNILFHSLSVKIKNVRIELANKITSLEYLEVKELRAMITLLITLTDELNNILPKWCIQLLFFKSLASIKKDATDIQTICSNQFSYSKEDMKMTDKEFKEYQETLSEFGDVWNYELSEEEQQQTFEYKKKIA